MRTRQPSLDAEENPGLDAARVLALSDGVFAIAATLLALDLRVPEGLNSSQLGEALRALAPSLRGYVVAYLVIGLLWLGHHQLFVTLRRITGRVATVNVLLLGLVAMLPFPSSMLADYSDEPVAVVIYAGNVGGIALLQTAIVLIAGYDRDIRSRYPGILALLASGVTAGIFALSILIALFSPQWATTSWLLLIPAHLLIDQIKKRF